MNKLLKSVLKDLLYIRLCRNKNLSNQICVGLIVDSVLFVLITHNHYVVCSYDVWLMAVAVHFESFIFEFKTVSSYWRNCVYF